MVEGQGDLFDSGNAPDPRSEKPQPRPEAPASPLPRPEELDDTTLIRLIGERRTHDVVALADEAGRRGLAAAIPALEEQCRAHAGWGEDSVIGPQVAALRALGQIGGPAARMAVSRLVAHRVVRGPGLAVAFSIAAGLQAKVPPELVLEGLHHPEPAIRAAACAVAHTPPRTAARLTDLLADLHGAVRLAAACALGRMGEVAARPHLLIALRQSATHDVIASLAPIADETVMVHLGQAATRSSCLAASIIAVLEDLDHPRAARIAERLKRASA